ncbi:MAG: acyl carrier protein [Alphaproteobacteria bacterium]|nr:MAG: acyl carrier protein [Alphaproteobacteria bacterium]
MSCHIIQTTVDDADLAKFMLALEKVGATLSHPLQLDTSTSNLGIDYKICGEGGGWYASDIADLVTELTSLYNTDPPEGFDIVPLFSSTVTVRDLLKKVKEWASQPTNHDLALFAHVLSTHRTRTSAPKLFEDTLLTSMNLGELDYSSLIAALEEAYGVILPRFNTDELLNRIYTVGDLIQFVKASKPDPNSPVTQAGNQTFTRDQVLDLVCEQMAATFDRDRQTLSAETPLALAGVTHERKDTEKAVEALERKFGIPNRVNPRSVSRNNCMDDLAKAVLHVLMDQHRIRAQ